MKETEALINNTETLEPTKRETANESTLVDTQRLAEEAIVEEAKLIMATEHDKKTSDEEYSKIKQGIEELKKPESQEITPDGVVANLRAKQKQDVETYEASQKDKQSKRSLGGKIWNFMTSQGGATTDAEVARQNAVHRTKVELKAADFLKSQNLSDVAAMKLMDTVDGVGTKYKFTDGRIKNVISMLESQGLKGDELKKVAHAVAAEYEATNIDGPEFDKMKKETKETLEEKQRFQNSQNVAI